MQNNEKSNLFYSFMDSPLGGMVLISEEKALKEIRFEDQKHFQGVWEGLSPDGKRRMIREESLPVLKEGKAWLEAYFRKEKPDPAALTIAPQGSDFQQRVWEELKKIPYGQLTTYGTIAKTIARDKGVPVISAQAVGGAVGRNPLGILVPCHRVIGAGNRLTGYAGGLDKKCFLLELEGHDLSCFR